MPKYLSDHDTQESNFRWNSVGGLNDCQLPLRRIPMQTAVGASMKQNVSRCTAHVTVKRIPAPDRARRTGHFTHCQIRFTGSHSSCLSAFYPYVSNRFEKPLPDTHDRRDNKSGSDMRCTIRLLKYPSIYVASQCAQSVCSIASCVCAY
jgi:hypothetical protein